MTFNLSIALIPTCFHALLVELYRYSDFRVYVNTTESAEGQTKAKLMTQTPRLHYTTVDVLFNNGANPVLIWC